MFSNFENIYNLATNVTCNRYVIWKRLEALKVMTAQIISSNIYQQNLNNCLIRERSSDTHSLDIFGVASGITAYADALHREATRRRCARRAARG